MREGKKIDFNSNYPSIEDLRKKARTRVPKFAMEYLDGGCNEDINLHKNTSEIREVELSPYYLSKHTASIIKTELFAHCRTLAKGAEFTFMGRSFMYGVSALGKKGGDHTISLLKTQLQQVMEQICCENVKDFPNHLIK